MVAPFPDNSARSEARKVALEEDFCGTLRTAVGLSRSAVDATLRSLPYRSLTALAARLVNWRDCCRARSKAFLTEMQFVFQVSTAATHYALF